MPGLYLPLDLRSNLRGEIKSNWQMQILKGDYEEDVLDVIQKVQLDYNCGRYH